MRRVAINAISNRRLSAVRRRYLYHNASVLVRQSATKESSINVRLFSATAAGSGDTTSKSNIFLDNLGKIFLSTIGLIIASLVRSSYGTSNKNRVRDSLEDKASIDPIEIDDLRVANTEFTVPVFKELADDLLEAFPERNANYYEVTQRVRGFLTDYVNTHENVRMIGSIEFGHLIDRVVVAALKKRSFTIDQPMPVLFWLTVLSLPLNSTVPDRIQILFNLLKLHNQSTTVRDVEEMVGYLQDTCQLVPETQVVPTDQKYPVQQYVCGSPKQLVAWEGNQDEECDVDAFAAILRSKSVCAWGECYHKKKLV